MDDELLRRYRGRLIFGPFATVEPDELDALENAIGGRLPSAYRAFIEEANGGSLMYDIRVPPNDDGEIIGFTELLHIGRNEQGEYGYGTLLGAYQRQQERSLGEHISMKRLLPIARDGGNDTLFLDLDPRDGGRLIAFVHGLPEWTGKTEHDVLAVVADSFDAYLDDLFISDETAEMTWEDVRDADPDDDWRRAVEQWLDEGVPDWRTRDWASDTGEG
ncbi:SMI1/KNR4 family protein [Kibdelosporangium aridum]|uniref:SMI1/KNR4 family protein n=1 Tax=Kibdelosporangium aridum TaxID=2030 RepID=A0A428ZUF5_KIBAR|nr:SMI1/KNR4 family protein [Kibdelosporangium aridum]RSM91642.1 SMI1/KNR4 family protein [Kibdelosporangium aridum]